MAFLSGVTHNKLVGKYTATQEGLGGPGVRVEKDVMRSRSGSPVKRSCGAPALVSLAAHPAPVYSDPSVCGVEHGHSFPAGMRCAESERGSRPAVVWVGETDGTLALRTASAGRACGMLQRLQGSFVTALRHHRHHVWAGYSDGYVRLFQLDGDRMPIAQGRKHRGGVTCFCSVGGSVFSGGLDFQVLVWTFNRVDGLRPVDQFSGHQGAVRCLAHEGPQLFSGGDDKAIRRVDLRTGEETVDRWQGGGWPIQRHSGTVSSLVAYEQFLFSASHDGTVRVWDSNSGRHLRTLMRGECPVLALLKDVACGRVWSAGVDGIVRVWNAAADHELQCQIREHAGAMVHGLTTVGRASATRLWVAGDDGVVRVWYVESGDSTFRDDDEGGDEEHRLLALADEARTRLSSSCYVLESKKAQVRRLQRLEQAQKDAIIDSLAKMSRLHTAAVYYGRLMQWHRRYVGLERRRLLCRLLRSTTEQGIRAEYWERLRLHAVQRLGRKRRRVLAEALLSTTRRGVLYVRWQLLLDHSRRGRAEKRRRRVVESMLSTTTRGLRLIYYTRWRRFALTRGATVKRRTLAAALARTSRNGLLAAFYGRLVRFTRLELAVEARRKVAALLLRVTAQGLLRCYWMQLLLFQRTAAGRKQRRKNATLFADMLLSELSRQYYAKWALWLVGKKASRLEEVHMQLLQELRGVESQVSDDDDDELRALIAAATEEREEAAAAAAALQERHKKLDAERIELWQESMRSAVDAEKSVFDQLATICMLLKAKGVNCRLDLASINLCNTQLKPSGKRASNAAADELLRRAVTRVRQAVERRGDSMATSGRRSSMARLKWLADSDSIAALERRTLVDAHLGVKEMVIAIDQLKLSPAWGSKGMPESTAREMVLNHKTLFAIVARVYASRLAAEQKEVDAFIAQQRHEASSGNPSFAYGHGAIRALSRSGGSEDGSRPVTPRASAPSTPAHSGLALPTPLLRAARAPLSPRGGSSGPMPEPFSVGRTLSSTTDGTAPASRPGYVTPRRHQSQSSRPASSRLLSPMSGPSGRPPSPASRQGGRPPSPASRPSGRPPSPASRPSGRPPSPQQRPGAPQQAGTPRSGRPAAAATAPPPKRPPSREAPRSLRRTVSDVTAPQPGSAVPGFRVNHDVRVLHAGPSASAAGICVGDRVVAVRGRHVKDKAAYVEIMQKCLAGESVSVRVQRAFGALVTVVVEMQQAPPRDT